MAPTHCVIQLYPANEPPTQSMLRASLNSAEVRESQGTNRFNRAFARSHTTKGNKTASGRFAMAICAERDLNSRNVAAIHAKTSMATESAMTVPRRLSAAEFDESSGRAVVWRVSGWLMTYQTCVDRFARTGTSAPAGGIQRRGTIEVPDCKNHSVGRKSTMIPKVRRGARIEQKNRGRPCGIQPPVVPHPPIVDGKRQGL